MEGLDELSGKIISESEKAISDSQESPNSKELKEFVLRAREQGQMIEQLIKNQIEVKDEMINKLHKELEHYKQGEADRFVDQVMKAIIKVRKDMAKRIADPAWNEKTVEEIQKEYVYTFEDLTDLLEQQNIDEYSTDSGSPFDPAIHQAKIEQTDDPALDKTIKESLNEGYKKNGKVLLPERVVVYQLKS